MPLMPVSLGTLPVAPGTIDESSDVGGRLGRVFVGIALMASGVQQLVLRDFVRLVPKLPDWIPWHASWAVATGVVMLVVGTALAAGVRVRVAAVVFAAMLFATFLFQRVPEIFSNPSAGFMWTNPCKVLALLGGALLLAGPLAPADAGPAKIRVHVASTLLGVFLLICGAQHFVYADFVDTLVPVWIPPSARFWTCFSGTALLAGGAGLLLPPTRRWAGLLSGLMIFLWVLLLHIPRALVEADHRGETAAIFEALAISGVCLLVAATGRPKKT
jgi:uncharacterized membrane protein